MLSNIAAGSSESQPLRLGFIGGGVNSAIGSAHFAACMLDNRFRVVSGCFSRQDAINQATAERWCVNPSRCITDWQRYMAQEQGQLDAICILTPIPEHAEMLEAALNLGIPVICEKALVAHSRQASQLLKRDDAQTNFLAVTLNYSGYPMIRLLRERVRQGQFGKLQQIHLEMPLENYLRVPVNAKEPAPPQLWRRSDGVVPTLLLDLGVHLHHLLHFITGCQVQTVMAQYNHFSTLPGIVDDAKLWIECAEPELQATMWMSKTALGHRNGLRIRLFGDQGSAEWYQFEPEVLQVSDKHGRRSQIDRGVEDSVLGTAHYNRFKAGHPAGYVEAFGNLYWDIGDALVNYQRTGVFDHSNVFGVSHCRDGLALLESATESHRTRQWTDVQPDIYVNEMLEPAELDRPLNRAA